VGYGRELWSFPVFKGQTARAGLGLTFGYTDLSLNDAGTAAGLVTLTTDTYGIGAGAIPPVPPYSGTVAGPGVVIPDTPTARAAAVVASTAAAVNNVEGQIYGVTLGPFLELPLSERIIAEVSGGLAVAIADRTYSFSETVATTGAPVVSRNGSVSSADWLVGGTLKAGLGYRVSDNVGVNLGLEYQYLGTSSQNVSGKTASLDLDAALSVLVGMNWSF
jgi:opacity protein-like surface antigen